MKPDRLVDSLLLAVLTIAFASIVFGAVLTEAWSQPEVAAALAA